MLPLFLFATSELNMIIDNNGKIDIENYGLTIGPSFTLNDILNSPFKDEFILDSSDGGDYERYSVNQCKIDGVRFWLAIFFFKKKISKIFLQLIDSKSEMMEWSMEGEMIRKQEHNGILNSQYGANEKEFKWGSISSLYDGKAVAAFILIKYKNN